MFCLMIQKQHHDLLTTEDWKKGNFLSSHRYLLFFPWRIMQCNHYHLPRGGEILFLPTEEIMQCNFHLPRGGEIFGSPRNYAM